MTDIRSINIDDYDYLLPESRIASHPLPQRDSCKLLVRYPDGGMETHVFQGFPVFCQRRRCWYIIIPV